MGRKVQKNLSLSLPVVEGLEHEADETGRSQADLVESALRACYSIGAEA